MPLIRSEVEINATLDKVYALAKDIERFPQIMPDVESVKILSRDGSKTVSDWVGIIRQFNRKVKWTEEDEWDDTQHRCVFKMINGDFSKYEGTWDFQPTSQAANQPTTRMVLVLDYEMGIPLLNGPIIRAVIQKLVRANCDSMVAALKRAAEG